MNMAKQNATRERVLVVEDEPNIREIINFNLETWGFEVVQANDGETALAMAEEYSPDLILLDLMLPKMDGIEVCRRLKGGFWTSRIPVIMLTAKKEVKDKVRGMEVGADDYITKPFSREELEARVKMVLSRTKAQRERNPLTSLPGQIAVQGYVEKLLAESQPFTLLYLDLDNFKGFNDYYGYKRGDEVIKLLADVVVEVVGRKGARGDYVGHIGGDDFMVVCASEPAKEIADSIISDFERRVTSLFAPEYVARGYFVTVDRQGRTRKQPCEIPVTIAAVTNDNRQYTSYVALVDVATEVKKHGKATEGSIVRFDRRRA